MQHAEEDLSSAWISLASEYDTQRRYFTHGVVCNQAGSGDLLGCCTADTGDDHPESTLEERAWL